MIIDLATIKVQHIQNEYRTGTKEFIRLTFDMPEHTPVDGLEAEGETIAEALLRMHEMIEVHEL